MPSTPRLSRTPSPNNTTQKKKKKNPDKDYVKRRPRPKPEFTGNRRTRSAQFARGSRSSRGPPIQRQQAWNQIVQMDPRLAEMERFGEVARRERSAKLFGTRSQREPPMHISLECVGNRCPISQNKIKGFAIYIDHDNDYYDAGYISMWYNSHNREKTPKRNPYTAADLERIRAWNNVKTEYGRRVSNFL